MASPSEILFFAPNLIGYLRVFVYILAGGAAMEVDPFGWFLTDEASTYVKQPISHHLVQRRALHHRLPTASHKKGFSVTLCPPSNAYGRRHHRPALCFSTLSSSFSPTTTPIYFSQRAAHSWTRIEMHLVVGLHRADSCLLPVNFGRHCVRLHHLLASPSQCCSRYSLDLVLVLLLIGHGLDALARKTLGVHTVRSAEGLHG